ncbi:MAG TPA: helix-turn-helix transcriptional regulator [Streptosporangiaceae bacterium]|nr:helix-turn-helix transcriptional regulator [Streptosporangiaceae bacterium]
MTELAVQWSRADERVVVADGRRLRQVRYESGLSQERLAWQSELGLTTVGRLERQLRSPCRAWTLGRLAAVLGQAPEKLLAVTEPDNG